MLEDIRNKRKSITGTYTRQKTIGNKMWKILPFILG